MPRSRLPCSHTASHRYLRTEVGQEKCPEPHRRSGRRPTPPGTCLHSRPPSRASRWSPVSPRATPLLSQSRNSLSRMVWSDQVSKWTRTERVCPHPKPRRRLLFSVPLPPSPSTPFARPTRLSGLTAQVASTGRQDVVVALAVKLNLLHLAWSRLQGIRPRQRCR